MATQERIICRLCLKMCHDFKAIELDMKDLLNVILPNIDLAAPQEPVMCSNCIEMVTECSDFRARCLYTHDYVVAFASDKGVDKVNLKDVYLSGNENGTDVPEDQDICFFCMSPVKNCSAISVVEEGSVILENIIKHCIPELDLSMIKKPVICPPCHGSLKYWYSFMMNCLIVEEKIKKYKTLDTNSEEINLNSVLQFTIRDVTAGDVDGDSADVINVKEEFSEDTKILDEKETGNGRDTVKLEQVFLGDNEDAYKGVKNKNDIFMDMEDQVLPKNMLACSDERNNLSSIKREETFCGEIETKCKEENFVEIEDQKFLLNEQIEIKPDEPYFNRIEDDIVLPQSEVTIRLQNSSKVTMYKCDFCLYQTKLKRELRSHLSKHKDPLEVTVYKCDFCSFETKSKYTLKKHLLEHKHPSEITMYKCDFCSFQTKVKCSLKRHLLRHKDPSED